jgi:hypothetical protein
LAKRGQKRAETISAVREQLDGLLTGCLPAESDFGTFRIYIMGGEILAAHAPDDGAAILRRLINNGALTEAIGGQILLEAGDRSVIDFVTGKVPDDLLFETLSARFQQNILDFLGLDAGAFEPMEAVFVDNLQVGHDSRAMLGELDDLRRRITQLRLAAEELLIAPGAWVPGTQDEARLLDLCGSQSPLNELLDSSPWEPFHTLRLVADMMASGAFVSRPLPPAPRDPDTTEELTPTEDLAEDTLDVWLDEAGGKRRRRKKRRSDAMPPADDVPSATPAGVDMDAETPTIPQPPLPAPSLDEDTSDEPSEAIKFHEQVKRASAELGDEMSMFADYDQSRGVGSGEGAFSGEVLDRVELTDRTVEHDPTPTNEEVIEVGEAEDIDSSHPVSTATLSFTGPDLEQSDTTNKIRVCNEVLLEVAQAMDRTKGPGAGRACIQLLVDGTPHEFAPLFLGIEVDIKGAVDVARVMKNLGKRPPGEHRRLVNRGVRDLIDRALSSTFEELGDEAVEEVMEHIAGYEKRLGF